MTEPALLLLARERGGNGPALFWNTLPGRGPELALGKPDDLPRALRRSSAEAP